MTSRLNYGKAAPGVLKAMGGLESYLQSCGLEPALLELVKLRASQINSCAFCIDMHYKDARAKGESEQRLYGLVAWAESPYYSPRERAALRWTEALTLISVDHVPDAVYDEVSPHFTEEELVNLTLAIVTINGWNRFAVSFRSEPGKYRPSSD